MSRFRTFSTTRSQAEQPNWAPLAAVSRFVRTSTELPAFHPGEFMWMDGVVNTRKRLVVHLFKHYDTRRYINLDEGGHAYEFVDDPRDEGLRLANPAFSGRYRLHRSLADAVARLGLREFERGRLLRSFGPSEWPDDPTDLAIGAYMNGDRYAWISAHSFDLHPSD